MQRRYVKGMTAVETRRRFLFNFFAWAVDAIYVERGTPDRRALRACIEALDAGWALYIAPEGTRSGDGRLQRGSLWNDVGAASSRHAHPRLSHRPTSAWNTFGPASSGCAARPFGSWSASPFTVALPDGHANREVREQITAEMMGQIAALLPPENRGVYAEQATQTPQYLRLAPGSNTA